MKPFCVQACWVPSTFLMAPGEGHIHSVSIRMMYRYKDNTCECGKLGTLKSSAKLVAGSLKPLDLLLGTTSDLRDS